MTPIVDDCNTRVSGDIKVDKDNTQAIRHGYFTAFNNPARRSMKI